MAGRKKLCFDVRRYEGQLCFFFVTEGYMKYRFAEEPFQAHETRIIRA